MNWTPSLGWNKPTLAHYARCKAGPPAADILAGVVPVQKVDLSSLVTIIDQGQLGSCTCNSTAQIIHAAMVARCGDNSTPANGRRGWPSAVGARRMACGTICGQSPSGTRRRPRRPLTGAAKRAYPCRIPTALRRNRRTLKGEREPCTTRTDAKPRTVTR